MPLPSISLTWERSLEGGVVVGALVGAPLAHAVRVVGGGSVRGGDYVHGRRQERVGIRGDAAAIVVDEDGGIGDVAGVRSRPVAARGSTLIRLLLSALEIAAK